MGNSNKFLHSIGMNAIQKKRLEKEWEILNADKPAIIRELTADPQNPHVWKFAIFSENFGILKGNLHFRLGFPFRPPKVFFDLPLEHPNVDKKGNLCLSVLQIENWKPATSLRSVFEEIDFLLRNPEVDRSVIN